MASDEAWDAIVSQCEYATFYQSREWAELWQVHTKGKFKPCPRLLILDDGTEVLLPLSCYKVSGGLINQYISSPGWTFGGYLSTKPLTPAQTQAVWNYIGELNLILRQNPFDQNFCPDHINLVESGYIHALDLRPGFEAINLMWAKEHKKFLQKVKQAQKYSVTIEVATTLDEWRQFYAAYEDSIQRWGDSFEGPKYEWELFEYIYQRNSPNMKLWVAKHEGQVITGSIRLYQNKIVHGWHTATFAKAFSLRPVQLMHYTLVQDACQKGYEWYDLGPSANSKTVEDYKDGMGFAKKDFNAYINKRIDLKTVEFIKKMRPVLR